MPRPGPNLLHGVLQTLGVAIAALGVGMVYLPLGLVVGGLGIVALSVAAELSQ